MLGLVYRAVRSLRLRWAMINHTTGCWVAQDLGCSATKPPPSNALTGIFRQDYLWDDSMPKTAHRWSGFPGATCLKCGEPCAIEMCLADNCGCPCHPAIGDGGRYVE